MIAVAGGTVLGISLLTVAVWNHLFRRRMPNLTQDDLLPDPMNDLQVVRKLREEDKASLKESFGTSPDFVWVLKDGDKLEEENDDDADDLAIITSYMMDFVISIGENYGHIIKSVDKDGKYQGSIMLIPPVTTLRYTAYTLAAMAHVGRPPLVLRNDAGRMDRLNAFGEVEKHHHEIMHDCIDDHWHVLNLGVAPSAQGKRVGTRLLQQAIHLAGDKPLFFGLSQWQCLVL